MPAKEIKNPDGTSTWIIDPYEAQVVSLLGDDFDYSTVSPEGLTELAERLRQIDAASDSTDPAPGGQGGSVRGEW